MISVRLAGDHLYGKQLFTWLSLVVSLMASFFPLDVLDEIWDLIESDSEGFLSCSHLQQGLSEPEFYGDLVYILKKNVSRTEFSDQFRKVITHYRRIGYSINVI